MAHLADLKSVRFVIAAASLLAFFFVFSPSSAGGKEIVAGSTAQTTGDVLIFGRDVTISSDVMQDVMVVGGSVRLDSRVRGDVVVLGGNFEMGTAARIDGDLVCLGGRIQGLDATRVAGDVFAPGESRTALAPLTRSSRTGALDVSLLSAAVSLTLLFLWLVAAILVTSISAREIRTSSLELRASLFHTMMLGLVTFTSLVLTAVIFSYMVPYGVGVPLLAILGIFGVVAKIYGLVAVFHAVGTAIAGARNVDQLASRRFLRGDLAMVMVGLLVLGALRLIPVVGQILWMVASLVGLGVAVGTGFGRREPWFLALAKA